ncbi:hypothetical protein HBH56_240820 [Parastagonospora nodorum]|nr:hypothetical protein HBH56_240820 [Parastagonospora nodorum]KAH4042702.1 hypothetical protein HBH49_244030 [Parastagonospora nodorum]KAH4146792.1 hypothetical protein HBH44_235030 [Parastagonospora nodorum]KAH4555256.1 hypothetical protein HBH84_244730 [Parastagonospora nodorum]KAH4618488.1 hypothetical protein HBH81_241360 [Parastagonospora nodorum]
MEQIHVTTVSGPNVHSSEVVLGQFLPDSANHLNTPFSEGCFSQFVPDSAQSYLDFDFAKESILDTHQAKDTEPGIHTYDILDRRPCVIHMSDTPIGDWLDVEFKTEVGNIATNCALTLLSDRIVADEEETTSLLKYKTYRVAALFESADRGSHRKQAVLDKVKVLLSPEHQICLSELFRKIGSNVEHQSLDLDKLPVQKLVQRSFEELWGPSLLIKERDVMETYNRLLGPEKLPVEVSDFSLLVVSLAWGALLDSDLSSTLKVALLDTVLATSRLLLQQKSSIRQFLLLLAEKTGSDDLIALITGSVSTATSLGLHLEPILRSFCINNEQAASVERAMWTLYCIDKSYALRWQAFPLVSDGFLPTAHPSKHSLQTEVFAASSSQWLEIRSQYSRLCSKILQLCLGADDELHRDQLRTRWELSIALERWYNSDAINLLMLSIDKSEAVWLKLLVSYYYHEARFHLVIINRPDLRSSPLSVINSRNGGEGSSSDTDGR